jgi:hypothetical protein
MHKASLEKIRIAAPALLSADRRVLAGCILTARYCLDVLVREQGRGPILSSEIAALVGGWLGEPISPSNVRQIIRALRIGGIPIQSATSSGYWLEPQGSESCSQVPIAAPLPNHEPKQPNQGLMGV